VTGQETNVEGAGYMIVSNLEKAGKNQCIKYS